MLRESGNRNGKVRGVSPVVFSLPRSFSSSSPYSVTGYSIEILHTLAARFAMKREVSRRQFQEWVCDALECQPELRALEWVPCVPHQERRVFEQRVQEEGFVNFHLTEIDAQSRFICARPREEYFPVYYVEPMEHNRTVFGFDLGSNFRRKVALEKARDTARPVATPPIHLAQEAEDQFGFLVVCPVYDRVEEQEAAVLCRSQLRGFIVAVFHIGSVVEASLQNLRHNGIDVSIYDGTGEGALIYTTRPVGAKNTPRRFSPPNVQESGWTVPLNVGGHPWIVTFHVQKEAAAKAQHLSAWANIATGLFSTGLLAASQYSGLHYTAKLAAENVALQEKILACKQAEEAAETANNAKSHVLANVSHEIRTPLNAILGYAQILQGDLTLQPEQRNAVEAVAASGAHLLSLINDVLDLTRIEARRSELRLGEFSLNTLLHDLEVMFQPQCAQKRLVLHVARVEQHSDVVRGDEGKLRQVLINLLGNAVKFTMTGAIHLRVQVERGEFMRFEVTDTGIGIAESEQKEIFHPFSQGSAGRSQGGTGLGLAIARQQVECMGGQLTCQSVPGSGSCFFFTLRLPFVKAETTHAVSRSPQTTTAPVAPPLPFDLTTIALPGDLHARLLAAAELHNMTVLKHLLQEMRGFSAEGQQLAEHLQGFLRHYDLDAVAHVLSSVGTGSEPTTCWSRNS